MAAGRGQGGRTSAATSSTTRSATCPSSSTPAATSSRCSTSRSGALGAARAQQRRGVRRADRARGPAARTSCRKQRHGLHARSSASARASPRRGRSCRRSWTSRARRYRRLRALRRTTRARSSQRPRARDARPAPDARRARRALARPASGCSATWTRCIDASKESAARQQREMLEGLRPTLGALGPWLGELNPTLDWIAEHQHTLVDMFGQPRRVAAAKRLATRDPKGTGHYLRQFGPSGAEVQSLGLTRTPGNRGNATCNPLALHRRAHREHRHPAVVRLRQRGRRPPLPRHPGGPTGLPHPGPDPLPGPLPRLPARGARGLLRPRSPGGSPSRPGNIPRSAAEPGRRCCAP